MPSIRRFHEGTATLRLPTLTLVATFILLAFPQTFFSAEEKRLSVYAPRVNYTISVVDHEKIEYVGLYGLMQPLVHLEIKIGDKEAKLKANNMEGHFTNGSDKVKIGREYIQLAAPVFFTDDQGKRELLIPLESVLPVLSRYMKVRLDFHVSARRLFIDDIAALFSAQLRKADDSSLVLTFPARVEPQIAVEGGKLRIIFTHDPIVSGMDKMSFDDKLISSLNFSEGNGSAEITVNGKSPLLASFADQGKTIVISAAPQPPSAVQTAAVAGPAATSAPDAASPGIPPDAKPKPVAVNPLTAALAAATPRYFVMVDASHGGMEPGARFSTRLLEKDVTLALARQLRSELQNRGVPVVLLRDGDTSLSLEQRAVTANTQRASLYISIHAGAGGNGVHIYTAFLPAPNSSSHSLFLPWEDAHAPYLDRSKVFANGLVAELNARKITAVAMSAPVPPLNNIATPAVVIEVSAGAQHSDGFTSAAYQQVVAQAAAAAIIATRGRIQETPLR